MENTFTITKEELAMAMNVETWKDAPESIKTYFRFEDALAINVIDPSMTFIGALTAMVIAHF